MFSFSYRFKLTQKINIPGSESGSCSHLFHIDAVAGHEALVAKLTNLDESSYRVLAESPYSSELGVAFAKDTHEDLAVQLTQTLEDMKQDGTIGRVAEKFGLDAEKTVWGEQGK